MKRFFFRHQGLPKLPVALLAGLGAAVSIGLLGFLTEVSSYAMLMAPFGASSVLIFAVPASPLSQPINVVGGHLICAFIGFLLHLILPGTFAVAGVAVGLSIICMMLLRVVHPPAGATALVAYSVATSWTFLLCPALAGSILLVVFAWVYHKINGTAYPLSVPIN